MDKIKQEDIERYIHEKMDKKERILFESEMHKDLQLKEDVVLQLSIHEAFNDTSVKAVENINESKSFKEIRSKLRNEENQELSKMIKEVIYDHSESSRRSINRRKLYKIIVSVAAIFVIFIATWSYFNTNSQSYYNTYANWKDLPSLIEKAGATTIISEIETLYNAGKFEETIALVNVEKQAHPYALIYLGASYVQVNDYKNANLTFDRLIALDLLESSRGYWYKFLIYLKQDKVSDAKKMLTIISNNKDNYNYNLALKLLKIL